VTVTKLWSYHSLSSGNQLETGESIEIAIYNNSAPRARISEVVIVNESNDVVNLWRYGVLATPVVLNLGQTYIFGVGPHVPGDGYNMGSDDASNCSGYLPNGSNTVYRETPPAVAGLDSNAPAPNYNTFHYGVIGISYTQ